MSVFFYVLLYKILKTLYRIIYTHKQKGMIIINSNKIVRATADGSKIKILAADTTELVNRALNIHKLSPVACAALGRALTASAMMGQMLKNQKDSVSLQIKGDGPLGGVMAISDRRSNVRGYVNHPHIDLPVREKDGKLDVGGAIGNGTLSVVKDFGMREPYASQVELISGEIGVDLTYYFAHSEQTPSVVALGVLLDTDLTVKHAGGYIIQLMPGCEDQAIRYIENTVDALPPVTTLMSWGETPESICEIFFGERGLQILETVACSYTCHCSREKMTRGLISLGEKELQDVIAGRLEIACHCHFCNKDYIFTKEDVSGIIKTLSGND